MDFDTIWILCMMQWVLDRYDIIMGVLFMKGERKLSPNFSPYSFPRPTLAHAP